MPALRLHIVSCIPKHFTTEIEADDVMQDVLQAMVKLQNAGRFSQIKNLPAYLACTASAVIVDKIRKIETEKRGGGKRVLREHDHASLVGFLDQISGELRSPSGEAAVHEAIAWVRQALLNLPNDQRMAVELCRISGMTCDEAGKQMGKSRSAIHGLLQRGLRGLRVELKSPEKFLSDIPTDTD